MLSYLIAKRFFDEDYCFIEITFHWCAFLELLYLQDIYSFKQNVNKWCQFRLWCQFDTNVTKWCQFRMWCQFDTNVTKSCQFRMWCQFHTNVTKSCQFSISWVILVGTLRLWQKPWRFNGKTKDFYGFNIFLLRYYAKTKT